jgi:hypothetical protein
MTETTVNVSTVGAGLLTRNQFVSPRATEERFEPSVKPLGGKAPVLPVSSEVVAML